MSMPTGDSPRIALDYYRYLQGHQIPQVPGGRVQTWHVDWISLAWMWAFVIALLVLLLFWVRQYRTTGHPEGITPLDRWGGHTTEAAGPVTRFFLVFSLIIAAWVGVVVVGHLVWGQKF
jgi:hypothetical protein